VALTDSASTPPNPPAPTAGGPPTRETPPDSSAAAGPHPGPGPSASAIPSAPRLVRRRALLGSRRRQIAAGLVIAGAIAFLLVQGLGNATQYYKTVPQAVADRASLGQTQFRIMGTVDHDVHQVAGQTEFSISYADVTAQVVDRKEPPQLFKPGIPVVLEGHWAGNVFQSDLIMVKHTAIYNPAEKAVMSTVPGNNTGGNNTGANTTGGNTTGGNNASGSTGAPTQPASDTSPAPSLQPSGTTPAAAPSK